DGRHLACVTNRTEEADFTNVTDVWIIPVDGGEARQLTGSIGPSSSPTWSPDGRAIAYYGHDNACMNATNTDVWIASAGGGDPVNLTAAADRSFEHHIITDMRAHPEIGGPVWSADGQRIFAIVAEGATNQLAAVDARGAGVTVLISGRREIFGLAIGRMGKHSSTSFGCWPLRGLPSCTPTRAAARGTGSSLPPRRIMTGAARTVRTSCADWIRRSRASRSSIPTGWAWRAAATGVS